MHVLGIQIDAPFVRAALLRINGRKIELRALKSSLLSEPEDVKQLYTKDFNGRIVSGISPKSLLIRPIELKIGKTRLVEEALTFQSEASSHFNPAEVLTIPLVKKKEETSTEALVFTIPRSGMKEHLLELQKLQIDPDRVSAISSALCSFIRWKFPNLSNAFIVDLGSNEWSSVWMEKGFLKKSYAASGGVETLLKALLEDRKKVHLQKEIEGAAKQIDLLQLKTHLNPHLAAKLAELRQEVVKAIYSFHREGGAKPLIFIGRMDAFIHLREFIIESLESSVFLEHEEALTLDEQKFAGVIGLALEERSPYRLQFRREEFFPEKNWKRLGIYTCALFALSVLLSGTLFSFSNWATNRQKQEMVDSIHDYLMGWDSSQKKKILSSSFSEEETVEKWVAAVETHNKEYPYIPQAPKMAEVLYWITTHPLIESLKKENDPISMREIRYQLVKFPKIGSPREPYLVKIEMEFQFKSGINARKFHEALLKGDEWVDSRQEVTWDALNDGYRASFFLKNRSLHAF